ncbi:cytochrome P450 [Suillus clintonianus]|uniref:cytochrome P450 n=1 Tax=Suillus clintonianus TaxID=1904413 RepID=UPI001B8709CA|nr:cytochrome P450 [Suillus clintonianus]KAG2134135.1 cytochrome P450 [Suillus clintonianus]
MAMFSTDTTQILVLGIPCIVALAAAVRLSTRKRVQGHALPLPPGPRGLPFLGNALQLDVEHPWLTYSAWGKKYGKIISSRLLGIDMIVINSEAIARELLDKRSINYSGRPFIPTNEIYGLDFNTVLLPYPGEAIKQHRQIFHDVLRAEASASYHEMFTKHTNELILNLVTATGDLQSQTHAYAGSLIMAVIYGHSAHGHDDPFLAGAYELGEIGKHITSPEKAAMFTAFPILEKMPLWIFGGVYAKIERSRSLAQQLLSGLFNEVKAQMANGTAKQSLVADFLSQPHDETGEKMMKAVALTGYTAGIDTVASVMHMFMLAMVLHPEIQERARAEINRVVKPDAMPCLADDRASLPYIDAILWEVLRCYPFAPLGVPHTTSNDDVYDGYFIPKGTIIMVNQWALSRDEEVYPDPSRFDPNRHLTADGQLKEPFTTHFAFGHGRRICPGRYFGDHGIWTAATAILAVLRINHAKDSNGNQIEIKPEFTTGLGVHPLPFQCSFEIVNSTREQQLRNSVNFSH